MTKTDVIKMIKKLEKESSVNNISLEYARSLKKAISSLNTLLVWF